MKKFATAYFSLFENNAVAQVFEAKNQVEAMKKAILSNQKDEHTREWLNDMINLSVEDFKNEVLQCEIGVDAIEI